MQSEEEIIQRLPGDLKRIARAAGLEAAVKIARALKGDILYVPGLDEFERLMRDDVIRREFDHGVPVRKLARVHKISVRGVRKALSRPSAEIPPVLARLLGPRAEGD